MTTFINFVPSQVIAPSFQVTLDDNLYTASVEWMLFPQRYFLRITGLSGVLVLFTALVGSPLGNNIAAISWANGKVTITTVDPHFFRVGQIVNLTIVGVVPAAYNGIIQAFVTGRNTFTFALAANPGVATTLGSVQRNINLVAGLFTSTMVYRTVNQQFEITP